MSRGQQMVGGNDPRLTMAAGTAMSGGSYALSPPPPPPLHMAAGMGPAFHDQLRYRDAQIAKLAGACCSCLSSLSCAAVAAHALVPAHTSN